MDIKTYQWIKGENIGDVVKSNGDTLLEGNIEFLIFTNGTRCNTALITEYLQEIPSDHIDDLILLPNEFKVVVYHPSDLLWAQGFLPELPSDCALFVQPEWDRRDKISADILRFIHDNPQWRLSLQTHKYVGIP